ncbi:MAG: hypothetical protein IJD45_00520 [Clostridia bacterium]|nr:hypothetical protein [Clostridia bacterium]
MKTAKKITLSAVLAALSALIMLVSYFPYLTYAVPAVAGLFIMVVVIEIDCKWAFFSFLAAAVLAFLFAETESKLMFIGFFGFYPILKCLIERINKPIIEWPIKFFVFNLCVITVYKLVARLFLVSFEDLGSFLKYGEIILLVLANIVFIVYDFAVSQISGFYIQRFHTRIARLFKR